MREEKPVFYAIRFFLIGLFSAIFIFGCGFTFTKYAKERNAGKIPVFNEENKVCFVIDAGHGGEDAGAVAPDGTTEKDLNLEIASLLKVVLELNGASVVMTRDSDTLLYDYYHDLTDYTGQKKVYDLKNRLKIAEEQENSIYVGIHMNKFAESKYSGLQIYYSPNNEQSYTIAADIKNTVTKHLQPSNKRPLKRGDSSIYILNRATIPAVLIECGFLSNENELELLKSRDYQKSLALNLFASLVKYDT